MTTSSTSWTGTSRRPGRCTRDTEPLAPREALGAYEATQHLLGNHLVTVSGDTAACTTSFQATHHKKAASPLWRYRFDIADGLITRATLEYA